jgi:hypothetical protein
MPRALLAVAVIAGLAAAVVQTVQGAAEEDHSRSAPATEHVATPTPRTHRRVRPSGRELVRRIVHFQEAAWHWQMVIGEHRTPTSQSARRAESRQYRLWVLALWKRRAAEVWARARRPPHKDQWLCIHRYEGAWDDPDAPYYGGLQMDIGFQETYGASLLREKGTADNWTPLEQMWAAERAHETRGFTPWPNTARYCGLI